MALIPNSPQNAYSLTRISVFPKIEQRQELKHRNVFRCFEKILSPENSQKSNSFTWKNPYKLDFELAWFFLGLSVLFQNDKK